MIKSLVAILGEYICIDETLRNSFTSSCPFLVFIPDKPGQMGIFFYTLADCESRYISRVIPKVKAPVADPKRKVVTNDVVLEMCADVLGSGRTVAADRGYTAIDLVECLHSHGLKYVGTIARGRKGLPSAAIKKKEKELHATEFFFKQGTPVVCALYHAKKSKDVLMVSTAHGGEIDDQSRKRKPTCVLTYNKRRCGVDICNKMLRQTSSQPKNEDWCVHVLTLIVDMCLLNAWTIYNELRIAQHQNRDVFTKNVAHTLALPWIQSRYNTRHAVGGLKQDTVFALEDVLAEAKADFVPKIICNSEPGKPGRCYICFDTISNNPNETSEERKRLKKNLRKNKTFCSTCNFPVCKSHRSLGECTQCLHEMSGGVHAVEE